MEIYDFIEATNNVATPEDAFKILENSLKSMGFDRILYSLLTDHPSLKLKAGHGILLNYPEDWMKHYFEKGYEHTDPVRKIAAIARKPFFWKDLNHISLPKQSQLVMHEAEEARLLDGIAVPLYGPFGEVAGIGMASSTGKTDISTRELAIINAMCHQFYVAYSSFHMDTNIALSPINLTAREREILLWCAKGKSNSIISEILAISPAGVQFHLNNICKKLNVNSRILAVVKAIRFGLISI